MIEVPALAPHLRLARRADRSLVLLAETEVVEIRGPLAVAVIEHADGHRHVDEIVRLLAGEATPAEVYYAVELLRRKGCIVEACEAPGMAVWTSQGVAPEHARRRLHEARVALRGLSGASTEGLAQALAERGVQIGADGELVVVVTHELSHPELAEVRRELSAGERAWIVVKPSGRRIAIGPLFTPREAPCALCFATRLADNHPFDGMIDHVTGERVTAPRLGERYAERVALPLAAAQIARHLVTPQRSLLRGRVLTLDLLEPELRWHRLARDPACPECSDAPPQSAPQLDDEGGLLARFERHVSPLIGIVRRLDDQPTSDGLSMCSVELNHARQPGESRGAQARSGGKGRNRDEARKSALGEAFERYSGRYRGQEPAFSATLADLGASAIHPERVMCFSAKQYAERDRWNASGSRFTFVPEPFDPSTPIAWTALESLTHGGLRHLPTGCCYTDMPQRRHMLCCTTNGCASGATLDQAARHALLELVERDAVALWWYNRYRPPAVDPRALDLPLWSRCRAHQAGRGRSLAALDLTTDLGIPVVAVVSSTGDGRELVFGYGAGLDTQGALERALLEHAQVQQGLAPTRTNAAPAAPEVRAWRATATLDNQPHFVSSAATRAVAPIAPAASPEEQVEALVARLALHDLEVLRLDQTRSELGVPTVRMVVPGLRPMLARYAEGRLYDVPVALGLLPRRLTEPELNPIPVFL